MFELAHKVDARKQSRAELLERRLDVIAMHQAGVPVMQIVERSGLSWSAVNLAIQKHKTGGNSALTPEARGRKPGTGRILTKEQEALVRQYIFMRRPWFYKLKDSLWSLDTVTQLIRGKLGVELTARCVGNYLKRWGITPSTTKKRPFDRCTKYIRTWLNDNYSQLEQRARQEGAEIYMMNAVVKLDRNLWVPGKAVVTEGSEPAVIRKKFSVASAVNKQGKLSWVVLYGSFGSEKQINFIKALLKDRGKPLYLIQGDGVVCGSQDFLFCARQQDPTVRVFPASSLT